MLLSANLDFTHIIGFYSFLHRVSEKTSKIIYVITTSNFHQIWQFAVFVPKIIRFGGILT